MKILLVATRNLKAPQTGRKLVLQTIVRSCESLGHEIHVAVVGAPDHDERCIAIAGPSALEICGNLVWHFLLGRKSLNECLYWSASTQRQISALVARDTYDLIVADMVRTAQFCARLRVPWILDLDDLLSERYARLAEKGSGSTVLGYFAERLPASLRRVATRLARSCLRTEAVRIAAQEVHFGRQASAVTLVSAIEAGKLSRRLGRAVHDTAASFNVSAPPAVDRAGSPANAVLFVGGLDYQPNLDAITYYLDQIAPELDRLGCTTTLHVVGTAPVELRPTDPSNRVTYVGYVDDLAAALGRYSVFVAPILAEGGIKTKVLEAMANGLAVIGTEQSVAGLGLSSNQECIVAKTPAEFAAAIQRLTKDAGACARIGSAGRGFVRLNFSPAVLREKWRILLHDALANR